MRPTLEGRFTEAGLGDALERLRAAVRPDREVVGWATVDLDRAGGTTGPDPAATPGQAPLESAIDSLLGSAARRIVDVEPGRGEVVLLEPSTEGRLAAALARHGEGPAALYLLADAAGAERARAAGFSLTAPDDGPFGPQFLVLGGPRWGPFLLIARSG